MNRNCGLLVLLLIACLDLKAQEDTSDLFSPANSMHFASYLMAGNRFDMAAPELERVVFLEPENDEARTKLLQCYTHNGSYQEGNALMTRFYKHRNAEPGILSFEYERLLIKANDFMKLDSMMQFCVQSDNDKTAFLLLNRAIYSGDWKEARVVFYQNNLMQRDPFRPYSRVMKGINDIRKKSPLAAAGLSALIPGLGKTYTHDWPDAFMSLIITGGLAWQSYRAFDAKGKNSALGWIAAGFAFSFYAANIYGSARAARDFNKRQVQKITDEADLYYFRDY